MIKHWTAFEGSPYGSKRRRPRVTLARNKIMMMNRAAFEALGSPEAVRFYFDEATKRIGIAATSPENDFAFPLKQRDGHSYRFIHTGAFCGHFGISPEATIQFNEVTMEDGGVMALDMKTTTRIKRGAK